MKYITTITLFGLLSLVFFQSTTKVSGKIVDEELNCLSDVIIYNLNNEEKSTSNQNGFYEIIANKNDTLVFHHVDLSEERITNLSETLNLIMLDKRVACFNENQTQIVIKEGASSLFEKKLKKLYKKANRKNIRKSNNCKH